MKQLIYDLQNRSEEELPALLRGVKQKHKFDIYLLKRDGLDLYGRELPPRVADVGKRMHGRIRRAVLKNSDTHMFGHRFYRSEYGPMKAVIVFNPPRPDILTLLGDNLWLRIGLAIIISGLVCFLLSRAMTNRIKQLSLASRRLSGGDLATRIDVRKRGGDETDELARDFNSMAERIEHQIEAQKRLMGDVSHELRSPLARLRIALALAQEDTQNSPTHLQRIDREAKRLEELIAQLLDSQLTEAGLDEHIDLAGLLSELCADTSFEGEPEGKRAEYSSDLEEAVVATHGDSLKKTFENILRNALKYTPEKSVVRVNLVDSDRAYTVRVEDSGPGVPEMELDKLFEEFYRVDTARARDTGGYGLGLAIAKRAINQHEGSIHAENTDHGLAIVVRLPIYTE